MKSIHNVLYLTLLILIGLAGFVVADYLNVDNYNKIQPIAYDSSLEETEQQPKEQETTQPIPQSTSQIDASLPIPVVRIESSSVAETGVTLEINYINFAINPDKVGTETPPNEGYAELVINEVPVSRIYSQWYQVPNSLLSKGENTLQVRLKDYSDNILQIAETTIQDSVVIEYDASR